MGLYLICIGFISHHETKVKSLKNLNNNDFYDFVAVIWATNGQRSNTFMTNIVTLEQGYCYF